MSRVLMIAPGAFPSPQGTPALIKSLCEDLIEEGVHVELFCFNSSRYQSQSAAQNKLRMPIHRAGLRGAGLYSGPGFLRVLSDLLLLNVLRKRLQEENLDEIILHAHGMEASLVAYFLSKEFSVPWVYHWHTDMGLELPTYFPKIESSLISIIGGIGNILDRAALSADAWIVLDKSHAEEAKNRGVRKIYVLPPRGLSVAEDLERRGVELNPESDPELSPKLNCEKTLIYSGNSDGYQNLALLFETLALAKKRGELLRLIIATHGETTRFLEWARAFDVLERTSVYQCNSLSEIVGCHRRASIAISPRMLGVGFPMKLLTPIELGMPCISCQQVSNEFSEQVSYAKPNPKALIKEIKRLSKGRTKRQKERKHLAFNLEEITQFYEKVMDSSV